MQGLELLLWAVRACSFFNTICFLWLGLAVLLNAQRRVLGTWAVGVGLLTAGLFFAFHTTVVGRDVAELQSEIVLWWRFVWLLFICPAWVWYAIICWYSGVLGKALPRFGLAVVSVAGILGLTFALGSDILPSFQMVRGGSAVAEYSGGEMLEYTSLWGVAAGLLYPIYGSGSYFLALLVLYHPGASERFMGALGRQRARPWLAAACIVLCLVCLSVGASMVPLFDGILTGLLLPFSHETVASLLTIDLAALLLLAGAVVLLGRAIVSYEIFTGKALPRSGFLRHWRNCLILGGGYGVAMGGSLGLPVPPIYQLTLATLLVAVFYGLLSWRSYLERERDIHRLQPFVGSQRLYEQLVSPSSPVDVDVATPFKALCEDVLGARSARLVPLGPMAPLAGKPLTYPHGAAVRPVDLGSLLKQISSPHDLMVPVDPLRFDGGRWAVPLWSERGLIGVLLLGEKVDGGLYVQEEIEIARATAERLTDVQASAEIARRLMGLQRQRIVETQLLDRRTRRLLHDEVLPRVHSLLLDLSGVEGEVAKEASVGLAGVHREISDLLREMPLAAAPEVVRFGLVGALKQVVEVELPDAFDEVDWSVEPEFERSARALPPLVAEVLFSAAREAIRNAARYGRDPAEPRLLRLEVSLSIRDGIRIEIVDDGVGLGAAAAGPAGSGQGLALHGTMMAVVGGTLSIEGAPGTGTRVTLLLPEAAYAGV